MGTKAWEHNEFKFFQPHPAKPENKPIAKKDEAPLLELPTPNNAYPIVHEPLAPIVNPVPAQQKDKPAVVLSMGCMF